MVFQNRAPAPIQTPITQPPRWRDRPDPLAWLLPQAWIDWFSNLIEGVDVFETRVRSVQLTGQTASIAATDFSEGAVTEGLYRIDWFVRVTRAAGTSSDITVSVDYQRGGATLTETGSTLNGNLVTTHEGKSFFVWIDGESPVRYSTVYNSVGAPTMAYELAVSLSRVEA